MKPTLSRGGRVVLFGPSQLQRVAISDVMLPDNVFAMNAQHVVELSEILRKTDSEVSPVLLTSAENDKFWLIEGRHRFIASIVAGRNEILSVISDIRINTPLAER